MTSEDPSQLPWLPNHKVDERPIGKIRVIGKAAAVLSIFFPAAAIVRSFIGCSMTGEEAFMSIFVSMSFCLGFSVIGLAFAFFARHLLGTDDDLAGMGLWLGLLVFLFGCLEALLFFVFPVLS
jgi:hypothetical protein